MSNNILYSDSFAYDTANKILTKGEVFDYDAINQSIENILSIGFGERPFNPFFGSSLGGMLFEGMTNGFTASNVDTLIKEILLWENRITFVRSECGFIPDPNNNTVTLYLTYIINRSRIKNTFKRKIRL